MKMRANAKINWALDITGRREDGFHLLDMLMQTIALSDELSMECADELSLTVNGFPEKWEGNLVMQAALALNRRAGTQYGARMALIKHIPERAGLGGGSADCAATLKGLNALWKLGLSDDDLLVLGATLGADVPFCLTGGLARVRGIGEDIEEISDAPKIPLVLVTPGGGLSTGAVFNLWDRGNWPAVSSDNDALAKAIVQRDLAFADRLCVNALTAPAEALMPQITQLIGKMQMLGASAAFMTGSGSTVVGAFTETETAERAAEAIPGAIVTCTLPEPEF